jgi:hypothetical protein
MSGADLYTRHVSIENCRKSDGRPLGDKKLCMLVSCDVVAGVAWAQLEADALY